MFLLGILSLLKVCFLPGYILFRLLKIRENLIFSLVGIFFVSLTFNHLFVLMATTLGIYTRSLVYTLFFVEIILCLLIHLTSVSPLYDNRVYRERLREIIGDGNTTRRILNMFVFFAYLAVVLIFLGKYVVANSGSVFTVLDAVVSWNRWAVDWYNNQMPRLTWEYPQLFPSVWSITYKFIGTEDVQIFAKFIMPLFGLVNLLLFGQLAVTMRRIEFALGALCYFLIVSLSYGKFIAAGYADIPVSAFSLYAILCVFTAGLETDPKRRDRLIILGFLICGGAFTVKQTGIFILASYPVFVWLYVVRKDGLSPVKWVNKIAIGITLSLLISAPWYVYKGVQLYRGQSSSNVEILVKGMHKDRNFVERAKHAYETAKGKFYKKYAESAQISYEKAWKNKSIFIVPVTLFSVFLILGICFSTLRWIHLIYTLPSFVIWLFLFSYDFRNLQPTIPFMSLAVASGISLLPVWILRRSGQIAHIQRAEEFEFEKYLKPFWYVLLGLLLAILILFNFKYTAEHLVEIQFREQKKIGDPLLNEKLYTYHSDHGLHGKVLTSYQMLGYLPEISTTFMLDHYHRLEQFAKKESKADYFLYHSRMAEPNILHFIKKKMDKGEYVVEFKYKYWLFLRKNY